MLLFGVPVGRVMLSWVGSGASSRAQTAHMALTKKSCNGDEPGKGLMDFLELCFVRVLLSVRVHTVLTWVFKEMSTGLCSDGCHFAWLTCHVPSFQGNKGVQRPLPSPSHHLHG